MSPNKVSEMFNSRLNPGVHGAKSHATGGVINGVSKTEIGELDQWTDKVGEDVTEKLRRYYEPCNRELQILLGKEHPMSWAVKVDYY
jgi:hypothetical protein